MLTNKYVKTYFISIVMYALTHYLSTRPRITSQVKHTTRNNTINNTQNSKPT
jgi:hypothetical protein